MTELLVERPAAAAPAATVIRTDAEAIAAAHRLAAIFAPGARARDRSRQLPRAEIEQFSASGLWAITVPREYGGADVSSRTRAQVIAIVSAADGSIGHIPQNHFYALDVLRVGGSLAQQAFFHQRVLAGERLGNALSEITHRDYRRRTLLTRTPGDWRVSGTKFYCTGALFAHWIPTQVTVHEDGREDKLMAFIPADAPGVTVTDDWDGFGQRGTGSGSVRFENVRVDPEWVVPFQASFDRPTIVGPAAQIMHAAIDAGIGRAALNDALTFIRDRARPWIDADVARAADDPLLVQQVGNVHLRLRAADALIARAADVLDIARVDPTESTVAAASIAVAAAKAQSTEAALLAANALHELGGTGSTDASLGLDRHWRNARTHTLHDPVRWKFHAIGNYHLNGKIPPRHGAL